MSLYKYIPEFSEKKIQTVYSLKEFPLNLLSACTFITSCVCLPQYFKNTLTNIVLEFFSQFKPA
jgi:hypothetical protein